MNDPMITCPQCSAEFPLTETLAQPLLQAAQAEFQKTQQQRAGELARRDQALKERESKLAKDNEDLDQQVATKVALELARVRTTAKENAKAEIDAEMKSLRDDLKQQQNALNEAKKQELALRREKREVEQQKEDLALIVQRTLDEERQAIRAEATATASEQFKLQLADKERALKDTQRKLEEAQRASEKTSQQLQGDVLEADLATVLGGAFPRDEIIRTAKGQNGADIVQSVCDARGQESGTILWESKRTKHWSDGWLQKLRDDQRAAGANIAVVVSTALPNGITHCGERDGVWITSPAFAPTLASLLRQQLTQVAQARVAMEGQHEKSALVYDYMTGPQFRQRIQAIAECFTDMQKELQREKTTTLQRWSKREKQITRLLENTVGLYGDVEGISGASLPELSATPPSTESETDEIARLLS